MNIDTETGFSSRFRGMVHSAVLNKDADGRITSAQLLVEHKWRGVGPGIPRVLPSGLKSSPPVIWHSTYYSCVLVGEQMGPIVPYLDHALEGLQVRVLGIATGGRNKDGKEIILLRSVILIPDHLLGDEDQEAGSLLEEEIKGSSSR